MRPPCLPDGVPEPRPVLARDVELPAEIADVRDARGEHVLTVDVDVLPGAERKALVRDVVARDRREDVACPRAPEPDRAPRRGEVLDPRVAGEVVREPLLVGHAVRTAGDHTETVVVHLHDREVGPEAAAGGEHRRVDHAAVRNVHLPGGDRLHGFERVRSDDVEDAERREVEHRRPVAHRQVLGVDDRRPPARVPLVLAPSDAVLLDEPRVRLVPVGPLPRGRLVEDGAELLLLLVEGRAAHAPVRFPLLARVHDPVGLVEAFRRAPLDVLGGALLVVEARDVRGLQVDLRLALHQPLRHCATDARPLLHPDRGGRPEPSHLGCFAEQRQAVGGQREEPVDRVLDPDGLVAEHLGHQLQRVLELELEVLLGERQLGRSERCLLDRRDLVGLVENRPVRVRADLEALPVLALVHVRVHVAHDRELDRRLRRQKARHRPDVDHLVDGGCQGDRRARHARDPRRPDTARDRHHIRLDVAARRPHALYSPVFDVDPEHLRVREDLRATGLRLLTHDRPEAQ